jgi:transcriptional regulator with XRE-family HTH domain
MGVSNIKLYEIIGLMEILAGIQLGRKIKECRKKQKITQEQLAELVKTSYKYIQRIEGKTPPDIRLTTIVRLAKALRVTPSKLLQS